ncbi:MAG: hypothetical protein AB9842_00545 [Bacteroidales bacterium]
MQKTDRVFYPANIQEALSIQNNHPEGFCLSTFSSLPGSTIETQENSIIIDLSQTDELNFFVEDHSWWFMGAALPSTELEGIAMERIPEFGSILLGHEFPAVESALQWLTRQNARVHLATGLGMNVIMLPEDINLLSEYMAGKHGIPCMISIPKQQA